MQVGWETIRTAGNVRSKTQIPPYTTGNYTLFTARDLTEQTQEKIEVL